MKKRRAPRTSRREEPSAGRRHLPWIVLGVVVVTFIGFVPSLQNEFLDWDDLENFTVNPFYRGIGWTQLRWMWTTVLLGHYVPVSWMTLGLDYLVWGMNPAGYHLTNVLLHSVNAAVFYLVARGLIRLAIPAAASAYPLAW
jgi:protein O-mannosyl-transferase